MAEPIVDIDHVTKRIGNQVIVNAIKLKVLPGEVTAICGANGAGKSTLLRMLAGIIHPTDGTIRINGLTWRENRGLYANQLGYMPDDYRFTNRLTARETLSFWAKLKNVPQQRVDEVLDEVGLLDTGKKPVASFSKGMRQRILFAQALLSHPPLIVLDEPTNGLDPYWMESFVTLIRKVKNNGHTVVFSTHQLPIAEAIGDRVVFMNQGSIVLDESVAQLRQRGGNDGLHAIFAGLFGLQGLNTSQ